jgi:NAD(P)H-hydrate epimerase
MTSNSVSASAADADRSNFDRPVCCPGLKSFDPGSLNSGSLKRTAEGFLTRAEARAIDERARDEFGVPTLVLMENAGRQAAAWLAWQQPQGPIAIVCGKGNNAGDGLVMARHLQVWGFDVRVLWAADPATFTGDAATQWFIGRRSQWNVCEMWQASAEDWQRQLAEASCIVDALLGTGTTGVVREPFATAIQAINTSARPVLAVDVPSGLDVDTGEPCGCAVVARWTVTFVAAKIGFLAPGARRYLGDLLVAEIGLPLACLQTLSRGSWPPSLRLESEA